MVKTKFVILLKPDAIRRQKIGEIISYFEQRNFEILEIKWNLPNNTTKQKFEQHYSDHKTQNFYSELIQFSVSGPSIVMCVLGDITTARKIVGCKTPWKADSNSIRGKYTCSMPDNLVHCSDLETADFEVELWFEK